MTPREFEELLETGNANLPIELSERFDVAEDRLAASGLPFQWLRVFRRCWKRARFSLLYLPNAFARLVYLPRHVREHYDRQTLLT